MLEEEPLALVNTYKYLGLNINASIKKELIEMDYFSRLFVAEQIALVTVIVEFH